MSIILNTDSYKISHYKQYPPGTQHLSSYIEARGSTIPGLSDPGLVFFGIGKWLKDLPDLMKSDIDWAVPFLKLHGFDVNEDGWRLMLKRYGGNALPIEVRALKEGTVVRTGIPMVQIENTDPDFPWLTSYLETSLLRAIWYPTTVATISRECKKIIYSYLQDTADDPDAEISFKLHDFGSRGVSSAESAGIGGLAHLINFLGTDNIEALITARRYYGVEMAGFSIPAAEHSTITSWGGPDKEGEAFRNMLVQFGGPGKMLAVVSDSYNILRACSSLWGGLLKDRVQRMGEAGNVLVVRPDSGDPVSTVRDVILTLMDSFGSYTNSKGYKVLPNYLRVIQGDGIDITSIPLILEELKRNGISASNVAFGMGGGLLQKVDRDTFKFAMKANEIVIDGVEKPVYKKPAGDPSKASKAGRQAVIMTDEGMKSVPEISVTEYENLLEVVYKNGHNFMKYDFEQIRERASIS